LVLKQIFKFLNIMKRQFFLIVSAVAISAAVLTSCGNDEKDGDDDGGGAGVSKQFTVTIEYAAKHKGEMSAVELWVRNVSDTYDDAIAKFPVKDGSFTVELPAIDAKYLKTLSSYKPTVTVSNSGAKTVTAKFCTTVIDYRIDDLICGKYVESAMKDSYVTAAYVYSDNNFTVSGTEVNEVRNGFGTLTGETTVTYSLNLKKGWNIVYDVYKGSVTAGMLTTLTMEKTSADQDDLKWYTRSDFINYITHGMTP
jgi:hypothetical protein